MKEKVLALIDRMLIELSGEISEAEQVYDNEWIDRAMSKADVLQELREEVEALAE